MYSSEKRKEKKKRLQTPTPRNRSFACFCHCVSISFIGLHPYRSQSLKQLQQRFTYLIQGMGPMSRSLPHASPHFDKYSHWRTAIPPSYHLILQVCVSVYKNTPSHDAKKKPRPSNPQKPSFALPCPVLVLVLFFCELVLLALENDTNRWK